MQIKQRFFLSKAMLAITATLPLIVTSQAASYIESEDVKETNETEVITVTGSRFTGYSSNLDG